MTDLAEAYERKVGEVRSLRRLYLGVGLFVVGALMVVAGMLVATALQSTLGLSWWDAREIAGVLAGLGVPAVFVGVFIVLPASRRVQAAAAIGSGIAILGVTLFTYAYPTDWAGYNADYTLPVTAIYFLGVIVTFWCLFVAVLNFKTRNDPGGTVTLEINEAGEVETYEVDTEDLADLDGLGGVGFFGDKPDGETPTQTNAPGSASGAAGPASGGRSGASAGGPPGTPSPTSDGGTTTNDISSPLDGPSGGSGPKTGPETQTAGRSSTSRGTAANRTTDAYCGNCQHFEYVRTNEGMKPRCGYHDRLMDDMDACEEWQPNS